MIFNLVRTWVILSSMSLLCYHIVFPQNLVLNPSFEEIYSCPDQFNQFEKAKHWFVLNTGPGINTPDLMASCASNETYPNGSIVNPISNLLGSQYPKHGLNFAHAVLYSNPSIWQDYLREFLSGKLIEKLINAEYCFSFYISSPERVWCGIDKIGALFYGTTDIIDININTQFPIPHQFDWNGGIVSDTVNWTRIYGTFQASGGEQYFHVGNFYPYNEVDTLMLKYGYLPNINGNGGNYINFCIGASYYFDYFELYELPALITPNDTTMPCSGSINLMASGADTYTWLNAQGDTLSTDSVFVASPTETTTYTLHTNQCRKKAQKNITVTVPECIPVIPNIITPGGNGLNDFLVIKNLQPGSSLSIYNRWGNVLFESKDYLQNWDCNRCSDGTYFYVLITPDGKQYKGTVTVVGEK